MVWCIHARRTVHTFIFIGLLLVLVRVAAAQQPSATPVAPVTLITTPIALDGILDEPGWRSSPTIGDLVQRQPNPGEAPTERTDVTHASRRRQPVHRHRRLRLGAGSRRRHADGARRQSLGADDRIEIVLDTFRDQRSAFYFATNAAGALVDGLAFANGAAEHRVGCHLGRPHAGAPDRDGSPSSPFRSRA